MVIHFVQAGLLSDGVVGAFAGSFIPIVGTAGGFIAGVAIGLLGRKKNG